jgi:hypothetical protein
MYIMMNGVILLASYGSFGGGTIGNLFAQWEAAGIFQYALPFLLIFALVFGLLTKINIFAGKDGNPNRGINAIIALAVAFMALQFDMVSVFFSEIFPRLGVALSIILVILILGGLFMPTSSENNWFMITLAFIVFVIIGIVIYQSLSVFGWNFGNGGWGWLSSFWDQYNGIIIFLVLIALVLLITSPRKQRGPVKYNPLLLRGMQGE